jgi:hypothetical protein
MQELNLDRIKRPSRPVQVKESIENMAAKARLNLHLFSPELDGKMRILNDRTKTLQDEMHCVELAEVLFDRLNFTVPEKRAVTGGTFLSDVGKAGPYIEGISKNESEKIAECFADIFGIDTHENKDGAGVGTMSVEDFLKEFFVKEGEEAIKRRIGILKLAKIDVKKTMREEIFSKHGEWTYENLKIDEGKGVPVDVMIAAASHHFLEGVNPAKVKTLPPAAIVVILLDQYDARRRRGTTTHPEAIQWLLTKVEEKLEGNKQKEEFIKLIKDMDVAFVDNTLYDNIPKIDNGEYKGS